MGKCGAARRIRRDLEAPWRRDALDPHEIREPRHEASGLARRVDDVIELVLARDIAAEIDAPHVLRAFHEPELGVRDAHLDGPPRRVPGDLPFPHAVPGVVVPVVVEERAVIERPGRIDPEVEAAALVVIGIDVDLEAVGAGALIAACEAPDDRIGMRVVKPRPDVERRVVVRHEDDRALGRHRPLIGIALRKPGEPLGGLPEGFVQHTVDRDGLTTPFTTTASFRATCSLTASTSSCDRASPVMPAPGFVMMEKPRQRIPRDRATSTSGAVDIPTASAPSRSSMRTSDGVSYEGPRRAA